MPLQEAVRAELLTIRKHADGVTVGALARTDTLRQVLGGGDPRVAYNTLKHVLIEGGDSLSLIAASYSLGYASDGPTHLARLDGFGLTYGYDQRHGRRYSDRGITELARRIATEWTIEASPTLTVTLAHAAGRDHQIEVVITTECMAVIEMEEPLVELVHPNGDRRTASADWAEVDDSRRRSIATIQWDANNNEALSILWSGELWPMFQVASKHLRSTTVLTTLAARLSLSFAA